MGNTNRIATRGKVLTSWLAALLAVAWFGWAPSLRLDGLPQASLQAATDRITYNVGEEVWLRIIPPSPQAVHTLDSYLFSVRYEGEEKPLQDGVILGGNEGPAAPPSTTYRLLWKVPLDARAGRYEVGVRVQNPNSHEVFQEIPRICTFVVHRQVIRIVSAEVGQPYYTSGDTIGCNIRIENLSGQPLQGLRLEFSERYWPWIVQQRERVGTKIEKLQNDINLKPNQGMGFAGPCAEAPKVDQPTIKQYSAVVWDHERKNVYAIAISPLVFVNPPGVAAPRPYPLQFVYPSLEAVNTSSYRHFHPEPFGVGAIQFDSHHTLFPSGTEATVRFTLANPTDVAWRQVTVRARLLGPGGNEQANQLVAEHVDLNPHGAGLTQEVKFPFPPQASGLFHAWVEITDAAGQMLAANVLELGVNPLPKSVLVFCAHEDDDGTQMGFIRSLVENQVPLHVIYFTSGDAGSCDRYFQHSCGPAEALNFGAIRMQEARAAMGHLGVPPENIFFLGLPDGGTGKIWFNHPNSGDPYLAVLLASDHAPYEGIFRPNLPFARDAVVEATEEIIKKFQPEVVLTNHPPAEGHIDHIVNNYFVVKALQELLRAGAISPDLEVRVDRIFDPKGYPATPYQYEEHEFYVSGEAMALAQEAGWFYQSQGGNRGEGNLRTWNQLRRSEGYRKVLDWKEHEGWNEKE
ncbi:MAG: PIG-L family deacetylase [Terriglobia bacterium]|jgi:LmbE family N-acetylglucosaminyl deacetylase